MPRVPCLLAVVAWPVLPLLYVLAPGHPFGALSGLPLATLGLGLVLLVVLAAWCGLGPRRPLLAAGLFGLALLLKLTLAGAALPAGLTATYTSGDFSQPAERSTEWRLADATRVERSLDLVGDAFPLHFFNDLRFNFYTASQPRRDLLPFTAVWRGWLLEPRGGPRCLWLEANGSASLQVGDLGPVRIDRATAVERRELCGPLPAGAVPLEARFARPAGGVPFLRVGETLSDGQSVPLPPERLARAPADAAAAGRDLLLGRAARALDLAVLAGLMAIPLLALAAGRGRLRLGALPTWRLERGLLSLALLAAYVEALAGFRHFAARTPILSGGNDWLTHESLARELLLGGPLLDGGQPLGTGEPFYQQPLYLYFLAGLHLLFGESVYGLLVAQYLGVALSGLLTYFLARELFGRLTAAVALGLFWLLRYAIFNPVAGLLLSENLVAILVPAMLLLLVRWQRTWRRTDLAGAGLLLGLAVLTRSTPLLFLPPALLLVVWAQRRKFQDWRPALGAAALLLAVSLAVSGLLGVRNYLVAGRWVFLPESATQNIVKTHRPTEKVDLSRIGEHPLYERLGLDQNTRQVLEFARQDPLGYGWSLAVMGLYALGVTGPAQGTAQLQYELIGLTLLYLGGLPFLPAARAGPVWFVHAFVGSHFLVMMVFLSNQYGFRLPLPMYGPMAVVAASVLVALAGRVGRPAVRAAGQERRAAWRPAALGLAVLAAGLWSGWEWVRPRAVEAETFGLGGEAGLAARAVRETPAAWSAERIYFGGRDGRSFGVAYLPGLNYREMKWLDLEQGLVWPAERRRGLLARPAGQPAPLFAACVGAEPAAGLSGPGAAARLDWLPEQAARRCGPGDLRLASFGGFAELRGLRRTEAPSGGPAGLEVVWQVIERPSFRVQEVVERLDGAGAVVASNLYEVYPSGSWEPGELVVAWLPAPAGGPAADPARLAIGFTRGGPTNRLTIDDPLPLYRQIRVLSAG
jgi:4-amino-4-deoxy-L-arabinose transferase-like glycosyltransferase